MNWKKIWAEFTEWYNKNDQSSWKEQKEIIEKIVEQNRKLGEPK